MLDELDELDDPLEELLAGVDSLVAPLPELSADDELVDDAVRDDDPRLSVL